MPIGGNMKYYITVMTEGREDCLYVSESRNAMKAAMKYGRGGTEGTEIVYITKPNRKKILSAVRWSEENRKYEYVDMNGATL